MSWELVGLVSKKTWGGQTRRLVALTLADKANDDGTGIYASVRTMARMSEVSEATARRTMQAFESERILKHVGERPCLNGYTNVYELDVSKIEEMQDLRPPKGSETPSGVRPVSARNPKIKGQVNGHDTKETPVTLTPVAGRHQTPVTVIDKPIQEPVLKTLFDLESKRDMSPAAMRKAAVEAYNASAKRRGWRPCRAGDQLSDERKRKLDAHLRTRGGLDGWSRDLKAMEAERWMDGGAQRNGKNTSWRFSLDGLFQQNFRNRMDDFEAEASRSARPAEDDLLDGGRYPRFEQRLACAKRIEEGRWFGGYCELDIGAVVRAEYPDLFSNGRAA